MENPHQTHMHRGTLYLRFGPMFSGKTTWLNMELTNLADTSFRCLKILHEDDKRPSVTSDSEDGSTHNSSFTKISKGVSVVRTSLLSNVDVTNYHVIGIDEAHFYPDLEAQVREWVEQGKHVRVVGLDGTAQMRKFGQDCGQILDLIPVAEDARKLSAKCEMCLRELQDNQYKGNIFAIQGGFTRKTGGDPNIEKDVGGADKYMPVCRYHHGQDIL